MTGQDKARFQFEVRRLLKQLQETVRELPQTTHASVLPGTMSMTAAAIVEAYNNPTGFNLSDLDQVIERFLSSEAEQGRL